VQENLSQLIDVLLIFCNPLAFCTRSQYKKIIKTNVIVILTILLIQKKNFSLPPKFGKIVVHDEIGDSKRESFDWYFYQYENICSDPTEKSNDFIYFF